MAATPCRSERDASGNRPQRLIIAIDFGTTYSAVAYLALDEREDEDTRHIHPGRIRFIQNYPNDRNFSFASDMKSEVPTEVMYPLNVKLVRRFRRRTGAQAEVEHPERPRDLDDEGEQEEEEEAEQDIMAAPTHSTRAVEEADMGESMAGGQQDLALSEPASLAIFDSSDVRDDESMAVDETESLQWGYSVHSAWGLAATHANPHNQPLSRFKLLLDNSPLTERVRAGLSTTLNELKRQRIIKNDHDVIVDFLTNLLRHTKSQLAGAGIYAERYRPELVLCVPAIWSQKASRDMQTALAKAMCLAGFEGVNVQNNCIENLFIVSEPEAAAAHVLATDSSILVTMATRTVRKRGEPGLTENPTSPGIRLSSLMRVRGPKTARDHRVRWLIRSDAGGGTVDANTYRVTDSNPLRLDREEVAPGGGLYGSSYINEGFRDLLHRLLDDELYLEEEEGKTIAGYIEKIVIDFEYKVKRSFDCYTAARGSYVVWEDMIPGLRDNPQKGFRGGQIRIPV